MTVGKMFSADRGLGVLSVVPAMGLVPSQVMDPPPPPHGTAAAPYSRSEHKFTGLAVVPMLNLKFSVLFLSVSPPCVSDVVPVAPVAVGYGSPLQWLFVPVNESE